MPDDAAVVVDTAHAGVWMGGYFDVTSPGQSYIRSYGHVNNNSSGSQTQNGYNHVYENQGLARASELWVFNGVDFAKIAGDIPLA